MTEGCLSQYRNNRSCPSWKKKKKKKEALLCYASTETISTMFLKMQLTREGEGWNLRESGECMGLGEFSEPHLCPSPYTLES